jgi:hypothetical protein
MKYVLLYFITFCPIVVYCQEINNTNLGNSYKKGYNIFTLSYSGQYYKDNKSVKYYNSTLRNSILPENTIGHNWAGQYERITRNGLILSLGLSRGVRNYKISVYQDLSNYDNEALNSLKNAFFSDNTTLAAKYWGYRLMLGYKKQLSTKISVTGKVGIEFKTFRNGLWDNSEYNIEYQTDDGLTQKRSEFVNLEKKFGTNFEDINNTRINTFEFYLGVERYINMRFLKNITIGLEANRNWWMWLNDGEMIIFSKKSFGENMSKSGTFYDRNISFGLRVGIGIWR